MNITNFDKRELLKFIESEEDIKSLEEDLNELMISMKNTSWKSSLVLIGSLIESCLYYYLVSLNEIHIDYPKFDKRKLGLNDMLSLANKYGVIDNSTLRLAEPVRDFRNLIHVKVQQRLKRKPNRRMVEISYNVLSEILYSINEHAGVFETDKLKQKLVDIFIELDKECRNGDVLVYLPILKKYGFQMGAIIIERTLKNI